MDMDSPQVINRDQVFSYPEPIEEHNERSFIINVTANFKRVQLSKDDNDNTNFFETGESTVFSQTFHLSVDLLMKDDDSEARAAIDALLEDLHLPSYFSFLTDEIIESGRKMWRDYHLRYKFLGVKKNVDVFVDELPGHESSDQDEDEDEDEDADETAVDMGLVAASKTAIEGLEKLRIDDDNDQVVTCSVSLEEVLVGSEATKLPCSHLYHGDCIVTWLQNSKFCPLCRFEMPTDCICKIPLCRS